MGKVLRPGRKGRKSLAEPEQAKLSIIRRRNVLIFQGIRHIGGESSPVGVKL